MNKQEYSGWTNYETWNVKLWLDNEQGSYEMQKELAEEARKETLPDYLSDEERARFVLASSLKNFVEENQPDLGASMYSDLLGAALSEVNWNEIAENILEGG